MKKITMYISRYGFFIASIYFFISYILCNGKSTDIGYGIAFLIIGLSFYFNKKEKMTKNNNDFDSGVEDAMKD